MSAETPTTPDPTWSKPHVCPFCESDLDDPGAGFVDHLKERDDCARGFEAWRGKVAGDMVGGWSG